MVNALEHKRFQSTTMSVMVLCFKYFVLTTTTITAALSINNANEQIVKNYNDPIGARI